MQILGLREELEIKRDLKEGTHVLFCLWVDLCVNFVGYKGITGYGVTFV